MFVLKTLVDKITKLDTSKLYTCFVDFRKAFDTMNDQALFQKVSNLGITGHFLQVIKDMYHKTSLVFKVGNQLSRPFTSNRGVRQGDNLSPNLFKMFINDLPKIFDHNNDPPAKHKRYQLLVVC